MSNIYFREQLKQETEITAIKSYLNKEKLSYLTSGVMDSLKAMGLEARQLPSE